MGCGSSTRPMVDMAEEQKYSIFTQTLIYPSIDMKEREDIPPTPLPVNDNLEESKHEIKLKQVEAEKNSVNINNKLVEIELEKELIREKEKNDNYNETVNMSKKGEKEEKKHIGDIEVDINTSENGEKEAEKEIIIEREKIDSISPVSKMIQKERPEEKMLGGNEKIETQITDNLTTEQEGWAEEKFMGRVVKIFDFRPVQSNSVPTGRPVVPPGELWVDEEFSLSVALQGLTDKYYDRERMAYRRPQELETQPCLFWEGKTSRMDVIQGSVGTCYFLSVLQSIADYPDVMKQLIPEDSYRIGTPQYDGIFHCRFWSFGSWEDVYIDDQIPSYPNRIWGAHNKHPNAMWVALMEKAFAKLQGSYKNCWSGNKGYTFVTLTGGTFENVNQKEMMEDKNFYSRISNALKGGSIITCSVSNNIDGKNGLIGSHAYSVTALYKYKVRNKAQRVSLIRVRNPWGKLKGEWTGAWSDGAVEWNSVDKSTKNKMKVTNEGDGEFWMTIQDFFTNFSHVTVCEFTPDVDRDGIDDGLSKEHVIRGKWANKELGEKTCFLGEKFTFEIPDNGKDGGQSMVLQLLQQVEDRKDKDSLLAMVAALFKHRDGKDGGQSMVLQLLQQVEDRKDKDSLLAMVAALFKVEAEIKDGSGGKTYLLRELTNLKYFAKMKDIIYRYPHLAPGKYMIVPYHRYTKGERKEFIIRIFTSSKLHISVIRDEHCFMATMNDGSWKNSKNGEQFIMGIEKNFYGKWVAGNNAGGQIGNTSYGSNPQYQITIAGEKKQPFKITLLQEKYDIPVGFSLMELTSPNGKPATYDWLVTMKQQRVKDVKGTWFTFVRGTEASSFYLLKPGTYILIIYTDKPNVERPYFLQINTQIRPKFKEFNVCK